MQILLCGGYNPPLYHNIIGNDIISYERILGGRSTHPKALNLRIFPRYHVVRGNAYESLIHYKSLFLYAHQGHFLPLVSAHSHAKQNTIMILSTDLINEVASLSDSTTMDVLVVLYLLTA